MVGGFVGCIKFSRRNSRGRFETRLGRQDPVSELVLVLLLLLLLLLLLMTVTC